MKIYLDTSSLIKLYHSEIGTDELDKLFENNHIQQIFLSDIAKIEFNAAIWKKVRTKDFTKENAIEIINSFQNDYSNYTFVELNNETLLLARELVTKYGLVGLRTLDSIQLACILSVKSELDLAITSDILLKNLIEQEEIKTTS